MNYAASVRHHMTTQSVCALSGFADRKWHNTAGKTAIQPVALLLCTVLRTAALSARVMVRAVSMTAAACYVRAPLELPGRELLRAGCTGIYLKPLGMRLLAAAASLLVIRHFLSTCFAHKRT